jgi:hypothetical protein
MCVKELSNFTTTCSVNCISQVTASQIIQFSAPSGVMTFVENINNAIPEVTGQYCVSESLSAPTNRAENAEGCLVYQWNLSPVSPWQWNSREKVEEPIVRPVTLLQVSISMNATFYVVVSSVQNFYHHLNSKVYFQHAINPNLTSTLQTFSMHSWRQNFRWH